MSRIQAPVKIAPSYPLLLRECGTSPREIMATLVKVVPTPTGAKVQFGPGILNCLRLPSPPPMLDESKFVLAAQFTGQTTLALLPRIDHLAYARALEAYLLCGAPPTITRAPFKTVVDSLYRLVPGLKKFEIENGLLHGIDAGLITSDSPRKSAIKMHTIERTALADKFIDNILRAHA